MSEQLYARPLNNSLGQIIRKQQPESSRFRYNARILKVDYVQRRLRVSGRGYSGPKKVQVQLGINLGTIDNPIVTTSNIAEIERQFDGKWICVAIRRKYLCATGGTIDDVVVDNDFDVFSSQQTDAFGAIVTPDNLFLPPMETLGQLSLPDSRFPGETTFLCGIPPCPDCSPDGFSVGMSPVYTADGCWVWGFKSASCGLYFGSQEAYKDYFPETDTRTLNQVVAVREHYAYVFSVTLGGTFGYGSPNLITYDISDVTFPVQVDFQTITIVGGGLFDLGIAVREDVLWLSGTFLSDALSIGTTTMYRYDISSREAPSLVSSWTTRLVNNFTSWLFFDTGSQTFTGQPYLIGYNWDYTDNTNCQTTFIVEDGLVGGEVQTISGFTFGRDRPTTVLEVLVTFPSLVCDNTILVRYWTGTPGSPVPNVLAIDLTNIPTSIATIWNDNSTFPFAYLGANHAYVGLSGGGVGLFTQVQIDDTNTDIGNPFPIDDTQTWGFFLKQKCLLRIGQTSPPAGWSSNVTNQLVPLPRSTVSIPVDAQGGEGSGQWMSGDIFNGHVYFAHVGGGGQFAYLATYFAP